LCNLLVCLALWMAARTRSDGAKLAVLWWGLLAFIAAGFEHSVANMTTFALGVFQGSASWADLAYNLAWTVPGNLVGGGLIVGLGYAWLGRPADGSGRCIRI
ncbi:MAG: formate/nitrite transporter family protein, partial [Dermatophilaceae bacterium]